MRAGFFVGFDDSHDFVVGGLAVDLQLGGVGVPGTKLPDFDFGFGRFGGAGGWQNARSGYSQGETLG